MTRRGGQIPWNARGAGAIYNGPQRGNRARMIGMALIVLGVIALLYFAFTRACGGSSCTEHYCASDKSIAVPSGYELVSKIYEINKSKGTLQGSQIVQLPLSKPTTDGRNLSFYRYSSDSKAWEPITNAMLDASGKSVSGTLPEAPTVLAILRRSSPGGMVIAYLPHNGTLNHEAAGKITMLHTFDFTPAADGGVAGDVSNVKADNSFQFLPVISAGNETKSSVQIVQSILSSPASRSNHVQNIAKKVAETGVAGIDVRYFDLTVNERSSFALFIAELGQVLHAQNKQLTVTLPSPIRTQDRIDEGAYDWAEIGKAADVIEIAPFRDQGTYRRDFPAILEYLGAKVQPATKLVLTVTPYATEKAADGLRTMTITDAMSIATRLAIHVSEGQKIQTSGVVEVAGVNIDKSEGRSGLAWVPDAACVAFTYDQNGGRTVWLENAFSVGFKLEYIGKYKLGGVAIEDASENPYLGNIWTAIVPYISSGQPLLLQPNANDLQPKWTTSKGTFEDSRKGSIKWNTPADAGTYTITLTLSDGVNLYQSEISANVQPRDTKTPAATGSPTG